MTMKQSITDKYLVQLVTSVILSSTDRVLHLSFYSSDFLLSLGFFPPFLNLLFVSLCDFLLTTYNYFFTTIFF